eukprot:Opistho-2@66322
MEGMNTLASAAAVVLSPCPFVCSHCPRTFQSSDELNEHVSKLHFALNPVSMEGLTPLFTSTVTGRTPDLNSFLNACAAALRQNGMSATAELSKNPFEESFSRVMESDRPSHPQLQRQISQQHAALIPQNSDALSAIFNLKAPPSLTIPGSASGSAAVNAAALAVNNAKMQLKSQIASKVSRKKAMAESQAALKLSLVPEVAGSPATVGSGQSPHGLGDPSLADSTMSSDSNDASGPARKRVRTDPNLSSDSKTRARELNREAAAKCRKRKKQLFEELKTKAERLEATNESMAGEMAQMREELAVLRAFVSTIMEQVQSNGQQQQQQQDGKEGDDAAAQ